MARLIDANLLLKDKTILWDEALGFCGCVLVEDIDNAPTIDAVPVVRCKDCKHYDKDALWCNINSPMFSEEHYNWYEDDFCSCGERRTDE